MVLRSHQISVLPLLFLILLNYCAISSATQGAIDPKQRVDCAPRRGDATREICVARGCVWDENFDKYHPSVPLCYFPTNTGYVVKKQSTGQLLLQKYLIGPVNPYSKDIEHLDVNYKTIGTALKVSIGTKDRFVPPVPVDESTPIQSTDQLIFKYKNDPVFSFTVERANEGNQSIKIWDTSIGGLLFGDQFIQIATFLPTDRVYGFGENVHQELKHDFTKYYTWAMLARDDPPDSRDPNGWNYYGVHPFYMGLEPSGKAHGVLIMNSNAQEVTTGPGPHITYRTIGGQLDIYFLPGPGPEQVVQQYQQLLGKPFLPAYWALGFQLCRFGFKSSQHLADTIKRQQDAGIPIDVAYADIDYMDRYKDFTYDTDNWNSLPQVTDNLHSQGMHLILIFDPAIQVDYDSFRRGIEKKAAFIEWPSKDMVPKDMPQYNLTKDTKIMLGVVWPDRHVAFPDFLDKSGKTQQWWIDEFVEFHKKVNFDGIWIDMNEPSNFGTNEEHPWYFDNPDHPNITQLKCKTEGPYAYLEVPPYPTANIWRSKDDILCSKTLCMSAKTGDLFLYDTHNLYGWSETVATDEALKKSTGKRGAVISRSTFPGSGRHGGHWLGDNTARWEDLATTIIGAQEFNIFGIPYVGSDVCGFNGLSNEELCLRWQQLGAFHSFYRNHNSDDQPDQDPAVWPSVANATKVANLFRYQHLPYLYTLHFRVSLYGGSVVRPVFFEFPLDFQAHTLSHQFMWGSSIMVVPVTSPNVDYVHGYLPNSADWYSISPAYKYGQLMPTGFSDFNAPRDTPLPTFARGGSIIPKQRPDITTTATRKNEFQLLVALCPKTLQAKGELYWDDGESLVENFATYNYLHFEYYATVTDKNMELKINCSRGYNAPDKVKVSSLNTIEMLGYPFPPKWNTAKINGQPLPIGSDKATYLADKKVLKIDAPAFIDLNNNGPIWTITWENGGSKVEL
ncbi:glycosyl hydrolases family 31 domain-containing protein [Ditylenchus destructor]|uniref:Glycosyl hydrolases family 31 domain-containing protein n=1 Tax=Ditylenchus destructor TaxID=166010 RepID=A0AAD4MZI5_9BILA|nr:glycosyl hydrolases family 31 domain-containing protein [Ditylenchus destructor]